MAKKIYITDGSDDRDEKIKENIKDRDKARDNVREGRRANLDEGQRRSERDTSLDDDRRIRERDERNTKRSDAKSKAVDEEIEKEARKILKRREQRRKILMFALGGIALVSLIAFVVIMIANNSNQNKRFNDMRNNAIASGNGTSGNASSGIAPANGNSGSSSEDDSVIIHYTNTDKETPDILPEFKELLAANSKIIGWLTIEGTTIDYPVAQTSDNEYYLNHDLNQNTDRNGTIFLDYQCDVITPSTNLILYGHHMQSGKMFGNLDKYESESYYENHKYITFDTIYEYGTYEVMYVFRSHVYDQEEIAFKYYQFIDAYSEVEFDSYMNEMAEMSLYDTGVTASYGDRLLTLSTCDYEEANGRFVVVAKKID